MLLLTEGPCRGSAGMSGTGVGTRLDEVEPGADMVWSVIRSSGMELEGTVVQASSEEIAH